MTNEIKYFSRNANELPMIFHFLNAVMTENASNIKLLNELKLSVEEIFMNMWKGLEIWINVMGDLV